MAAPLSQQNGHGVQTAQLVFQEASTQLYESLSEKQRKNFRRFPDAQSMLSSIDREFRSHPIHGSRITKLMNSISTFSDGFSPFFQVVNIFIQSNPEYAAIFWGSIFLVMQLAGQFAKFLDRVSDMLGSIGDELPAYGELLHIVQERRMDLHESQREGFPRIIKALSEIYGDILRFCQDLCGVFKKSGGTFSSLAKVTVKMAFCPFDTRFNALLGKLSTHKQLLVFETYVFGLQYLTSLPAKFWDVTDRKFISIKDIQASRKAHSDAHNTGLETAKETINEKIKDKKSMEKELKVLKFWINASNWEQSYNDSSRRTHIGTGKWFFKNPDFSAWVERIRNSVLESHPRGKTIFLVEANPGYGKTTLCASLIQWIQQGEIHRTAFREVAYFFFDKNRPVTERSTLEALRAIATQILHMHQDDASTLDGAAILMRSKAPTHATSEDLVELLRWLFQRYPNTILVFDGTDECSNSHEFLEYLQQTIAPSYCLPNGSETGPSNTSVEPFVAIFQRPTVKLTPFWKTRQTCVSLQAHHNLADIEAFLYTTCLELQQQELLPIDQDLSSLSARAARNANGMFLWAKLLAGYLQSDLLTLRDIIDALTNTVRFTTLEEMCNTILEGIQRRLEAKAKLAVGKIFNLLVGCLKPISVTELHLALTASDDNQPIPNFQGSLRRMTGALVEITDSRTARFIHDSVSSYMEDQVKESRFGLGPIPKVNYLFAMSSLQYLVTQLPRGPLSGSESKSANSTVLKEQYPFLDYTIHLWTTHAELALEHSTTTSTEMFGFIDLLGRMVTNKDFATAWIETSWTFRVAPRLDGLSARLRKLISDQTIPEIQQQFEQLSSRLSKFAIDLQTLNREWGTMLSQSPSDIWRPDMANFFKSQFWHCNADDTKLFLLGPVEDSNKCIIPIASATSSDGSEVGYIRLKVAQSTFDDTGRRWNSLEEWLNHCSKGWIAIYEIWCLEKKEIRSKVQIDLRQEDVELILRESQRPLREHYYGCEQFSLSRNHFEFPVSFSKDLRQIVVLGSLLRLRDTQTRHNNYSYGHSAFHHLELAEVRRRHPHETASYSFGSMFSPKGNHLLFTRPADPTQLIGRNVSWELLIFSDIDRLRSDCSVARSMASLIVERPRLTMGGQDWFKGHFSFHPKLPVLVFDGIKSTFLWCFSKPDAGTKMIHRYPLMDISFNDDGNYIHGYTSDLAGMRHQIVVENLTQTLEKLFPQDGHEKGSSSATTLLARNHTTAITFGNMAVGGPRAQEAGAVAFTRNPHGQAQMSVLQQIQEDNSVVLSTVSENGALKHERLTKLPKTLMSATPVLAKRPSSCTSSATDETFSLVWNTRSTNGRYSFSCIDTILPPLLMERRSTHILSLSNEGSQDEVFKLPVRGIGERLEDQTKPKRPLEADSEENGKRQRLEGGSPTGGL